MAAQALSDDQISEMRSIIQENPTISLRDAVMSWRGRAGQPMNEALLTHLSRVYEDERHRVVALRFTSLTPMPKPRIGDEFSKRPIAVIRTLAIGLLAIVGNTVVGLGAAMAVLSILFTPQGALGIVFVAFFCTAGVSTVLILPLACLLGWAMTSLARVVFNATVRAYR